MRTRASHGGVRARHSFRVHYLRQRRANDYAHARLQHVGRRCERRGSMARSTSSAPTITGPMTVHTFRRSSCAVRSSSPRSFFMTRAITRSRRSSSALTRRSSAVQLQAERWRSKAARTSASTSWYLAWAAPRDGCQGRRIRTTCSHCDRSRTASGYAQPSARALASFS